LNTPGKHAILASREARAVGDFCHPPPISSTHTEELIKKYFMADYQTDFFSVLGLLTMLPIKTIR